MGALNANHQRYGVKMTKAGLPALWKAFLCLVLVATALMLNGCSSVTDTLAGVDYACVDIQVDGPYTDSGAQGRGIKLPEGETLTPETIAALCN